MSTPRPHGADRREVRIRRAPRIGVFLVGGAMLGVLGTLVATSLFEPDPNVGFAASFGYFLVYGVPAGLALGAVVALVLDAASRRRARTATVEREAGGASEDEAPEDPPPGDPQPEDPPAGDRPVS